jgi:putative NIF3 family GTP cyclohydrolase 1 type 2
MALVNQPTPPKILPTVREANQFLATFFPTRPRDVQWLYHEPRNWSSSPPPETNPVARIICSITPTPGVYTAMHKARTPPPLVFLHRPFDLDRRRVPRGAHVLSSHVGFDEVLTTGWNEALAARLGMYTGTDAVCIQGYKGDPCRRIGLVSPLCAPSATLESIATSIKHEFGTLDAVYNVDAENDIEMAQHISVVAIMNGFDPEQVQRVMEAAHSKGWISDAENGEGIVYLTGQAREAGLTAAREKKMKVFCVGHGSCEEWGIRYLACELRREFPMVHVCEVYEDEESRPPKPKPELKGR